MTSTNRKPAAAKRLERDLAQPQKSDKLFYSPDEPIRVTLGDGGVAIIDTSPRTLPQKYWRAATRAGALIKGGLTAEELKGPEGSAESDPHARAEMILKAVLDAVAADDGPGFENSFTAAGIPNVRWIETRVGFGIDASERDQAWAQAQKILDEKEGKEETDDDDEEKDVLLADKTKLAEKGGTFADID